jgi:hypothetical protein
LDGCPFEHSLLAYYEITKVEISSRKQQGYKMHLGQQRAPQAAESRKTTSLARNLDSVSRSGQRFGHTRKNSAWEAVISISRISGTTKGIGEIQLRGGEAEVDSVQRDPICC